MPRSGTTWVVRSLNLHPRILAFGETYFFSREWVRPARNGRYAPAQLERIWNSLAKNPFWASVPLKKDLGQTSGWLSRTSRDDIPEVIASAQRIAGPDPTPSDLLDSIGRAFCEREGKNFWVEKTAAEGKHVLHTVKKVPDARFILTMREPLGFFRSYKYQGITPDKKNRAKHSARYHPLLGALVWRISYRNILKIQASHPDQVSVFVLSDDDSRRQILQDVCSHLGVEPDDAMYELLGKKVNSNESSDVSRILEPAEIAWIRLLCNVDDSRLRLPDDLSGGGFLSLLKSILTIPGWLCRYLRTPKI